MSLPDLSLRRPVMATVLNLLIVLIGAVAMSRLPVRELPQVEAAQVTVRVDYTGAGGQPGRLGDRGRLGGRQRRHRHGHGIRTRADAHGPDLRFRPRHRFRGQ